MPGPIDPAITAPGRAEMRAGGRTVPEWTCVAAATAVLLAIFTGLRLFAMTACRLPEEAFAEPSILVACAVRRGGLLSGGFGGYLLLLVLVPRLRQGWHSLEDGGSLRLLVGVLALALAWAGAGYAYNFWYDRPHPVDRTVLWVLAGLIFWRPAFVFPFTVAFWALMWQFEWPGLGFGVLVAEFRPVVHVLIAFVAAFLIGAISARGSTDTFLFLALCLVAANYWVPASAKLQIGWLSHGHLYFLLPNAYTHGWLAFLDAETVARVARALALADWPMRAATILVEGSAILVFASARTARVLLAAFTALLLLFFLTIGFFFWKWMVLQAGLWLVLSRSAHGMAWRDRLFTRTRRAASVLVIASAPWWCAPAALAWFDTPLTSTLQFEAVGASDTLYELPPAFFAPYESQIAMGTFVGSLAHAPVLAGSYGVTSLRERADALLDAHTPADVRRLEVAIAPAGAGHPDETFARTFDELVRRAGLVSNRALSDQHGVAWLRPPAFLRTFPRGRAYEGEEPIAAIRIFHVSSFFDGVRHHLFRRELLRTVPIPPAQRG